MSTIFITGIIFRLLFVTTVPVNYDAGFFLYDASRIIGGSIPIVDYPSRSPLFHYILAGLLLMDVSPIAASRGLMLLISVITGFLVFKFTSRYYSRRAGTAAVAFYFFTPFGILWGWLLMTQHLAQMVFLVGMITCAPGLWRKHKPIRPAIVLGGFLGLEFLIRRVALANLLAVCLFIMYIGHKERDNSILDAVKTSILVAILMLAVTLVGFLILGRFSIEFMVGVIDNQFSSLIFQESASTTSAIRPTGSVSVIEIVQKFCPRCRFRGIQIISRTILVALPVMLPLLVYARWSVHQTIESPNFRKAIGASLGLFIVGWWAFLFWFTPAIKFMIIPIGILSLAALGYLWWIVPMPEDIMSKWSPGITLVAILPVVMVAGYMYRDDPLWIGYFQDLFPYISILTGIVYAKTTAVVKGKKWMEPVGTVILALVLINSLFVGLNIPPMKSEANSISVTGIQKAGEDLRDRTQPTDIIFTAQPLYVIEAGRENYLDFSRIYWAFERRPDAPITKKYRKQLREGVSSGEIDYIIYERRTEVVFESSPKVRNEIEEHYCQIITQDNIYESMNAQLLKRSTEASNCPSNEVSINGKKLII